MAKTKLTPQKQFELLRSVQLIGVMAQMIQVEFQNHFVDTKHRNPIINNHAKRIKESSETIMRYLKQSGFEIKDKEEFNYDYVLNMYEIFAHFTQMSPEQLKEYNHGLQQIIKEAV